MKLHPWANVAILKALSDAESSLELMRADSKILHLCMQDFGKYMIWFQDNNTKIRTKLHVKESVEFVTTWVGLWWKKYKQRVKIQLAKSKKKDIVLTRGEMHLRHFSVKERDSIINELVNEFIKNGEICCSTILANAIFRRILGRHSKSKKWDLNAKVNLLSMLKREVRMISRTSGYLIFLVPTKDYYRLREYRNDGSSPIV